MHHVAHWLDGGFLVIGPAAYSPDEDLILLRGEGPARCEVRGTGGRSWPPSCWR